MVEVMGDVNKSKFLEMCIQESVEEEKWWTLMDMGYSFKSHCSKANQITRMTTLGWRDAKGSSLREVFIKSKSHFLPWKVRQQELEIL